MKYNLKIIHVILLLAYILNLLANKIESRPKTAKLGDFPSVVSLVFSGVGHLCSGVLFSTVHLTLPGHCVLVDEPILRGFAKVVAGDIHWNGSSLSRQERDVKSIYLHPNYDCQSFENDIAVVVVQEPFILSEYIKLVIISDNLPDIGSRCYAPYWKQNGSDALQYIKLTIVRFESCSNSQDEHLQDKTICANHPGDCKKYVGGPIFCMGALQGLGTGGKKICDTYESNLKYTAIYTLRPFMQSSLKRRKESNIIPKSKGVRKIANYYLLLLGVRVHRRILSTLCL